MAAVKIYVKTAAGAEELRTRERRLPPRLRTMLLRVDGSRSTALLQRSAQQQEAPDDFLSQLHAMGLIAVRETAAEAPVADETPAAREPSPAPAAKASFVKMSLVEGSRALKQLAAMMADITPKR